MKKNRIMIALLALVLMIGAAHAVAEEYTAERENALAAVKVSLPDAVRDRDDGRYEWDVFFTQDNQLGKCQVLESSNELRKVKLYEKPEGALTASEAMALLAEKKGELTVVDLDLDRDDGRIRYEGEAELDGRRYEFEMSVNGDIIEWERD